MSGERILIGIVTCLIVATCGGVSEGPPPAPGQTAAFVEHNDVQYRVEKFEVDGVETVVFFDAERSYTAEELRQHVGAQEPAILTPAVKETLADAAPDRLIELIVVLRSQPAGPISRQVRAAVAAELSELSEQIRAITRRSLPAESLSPLAERLFVPKPLPPEDLQARRALAIRRDELERRMRVEIARQIAAAVEPEQAALAVFIEQLPGEVTGRTSVMSVLGVRIAARHVLQLAGHPLVARIDLNHPGEPELDVTAPSLGVDTGFWAAGINGGVHDVGVLDSGVEQNHPALSSHAFLSNMGTHDTGTHGTAMAGVFASTDETIRGIAYGCDTIVVARAGNIYTPMLGMDYIAGTGEPECVNYSYGNGTANYYDYSPTDQFFDGVIDTFGLLVSKSCGNGGYHPTAPTITHPAPAYNLLATANMEDFNTITRDDDSIRYSSSTGPTVAGRKKPDITSPGTEITTCDAHWAGGGLWRQVTGTSPASPHTGSAIVLLYDMGTDNVMAGKAVALNTTDAIDDNGTQTPDDDFWVPGSLWNRRYGWGYMNLSTAYLHGLDVFVDSIPDEPENADFRLFAGQMFENEKVTLVWQRHVAYNGSTFPTYIEDLSDLDLTAYREADNATLAESWSRIDNVEQLDVDEDTLVVLKVEAFGQFDPDVPTEQFALATQENFVAIAGPAFAPDFTHPACVGAATPFPVTVEVANMGDVAAHDVLVELSGVTILAGPNPAGVGSIPTGQSAGASWTVQAAPGPGTHPIAADVTSNSYGEDFTGTGDSSYLVGDCSLGDLNCDGVLNAFDIDPFVLALTDPDGYAAAFPYCDRNLADVNGDGVINAFDIDPFVELLTGP